MERVIISVSISNDIKERAERAIKDGKLGISDFSALVEYALDHLLCIKEVGDMRPRMDTDDMRAGELNNC